MNDKDVISVVLSQELGARLRELAEKDKRSVSSFIRIILEDKFEE